ncbi:hypothetical protein PSPO01_12914 [Paraphaeosphaeria sporulosa]
MAWNPLFDHFYHVDDNFRKKWPRIVKPAYEDVRLQILLYAGREAAASLHIAAPRRRSGMGGGDTDMVDVAEQAMLYEPFTYWDWHGYDAEGKPLNGSRHLHEGGRKIRLLWERERAFSANGEKNGDLTPRERWEGFKRFVERGESNRRSVKRMAVANWMTKGDMEWIAKTLTRLEALDLSDVPSAYSACSVQNENTWLGYLKEAKFREPIYKNNLFEMFPLLRKLRDNSSYPEEVRMADLYEHRHDHTYKTDGPSHAFKLEKTESFEEWFWRLQAQVPCELSGLEEEIAETHLWKRVKWLGLPDWRSSSYAAKTVGSTLPPWCVSMKTVSIRGEYTRDRSSNEFESIHDHVCRFILGVKRIIPASVTKLELRLSVSFLRYFLEQLEKNKPTIQRVGIDLGAWVQIFPLGNPLEHLEDDDIRATTRRLARNVPTLQIFHPKKYYYREVQGKEEAFAAEQDYVAKQPSFYRNRSGNFEPARPIRQAPRPETPVESAPADYDFFEDLQFDRTKQNDACPLDGSIGHRATREKVDSTRANTLAKLLEKLHLARHRVGEVSHMANMTFRQNRAKSNLKITREGAHLFGLPGEAQTRSFDPIDPLTLTQQEVKTDFRAGNEFQFWNPEGLKMVYPWIAKTFGWRPVFDWDWFMVPRNMSGTENPNLVTINSSGKRGSSRPADWQLEGKQSDGRGKPGKALESTLGAIKKQFALLNEAGIPVHLLIGRRDPDISSVYWGWPYTKQAWKEWNEQYFSASLETIAEHVDTLSIMYDLRNPIDKDRLSFIDAKRPYHPPHGKCPTRVCRLEEHNGGKCPFIEKYPGQRNKHPRPQVKPAGESDSKKKKKKDATLTYSALADSGSCGPPTGELADDEANEDDSDDEDEVFPLHLARRSVYLRETVGWIRFWEAYGSSFTKLTALHVRMPRSHDNAGSWRLARLLNRHAGWHIIYHADERQHMQSEEDLISTFDNGDPTAPGKEVWTHLKESRVWPAGRFVRRTWVWDPLRLVDESFSVVEEEDWEDAERNPKAVGKKFNAFRFEPRQRRELTSHDNLIEVREIEALKAARRKVEIAIANEEANGDPKDADGLPIKPDMERIPRPDRLPHMTSGFAGRLQSVYGHHVRNVAGGQWREELRGMIAFMESGYGGEADEAWRDERDRLKELLAEDPPYSRIFEVRDDRIALRDVPVKQWDEDDGDAGQPTTAAPADTETQDASTPPFSGESFLDTSEVDSLFVDSETEGIAPLPTASSPTFTSPQHNISSGNPSSSRLPGPSRIKKPHTAGPFDQSSSEDNADDGADDKKGGSAVKVEAVKVEAVKVEIEVKIPKKLQDLGKMEEGVVKAPQTPFDEEYTDGDDGGEDEGETTDKEGVDAYGGLDGSEAHSYKFDELVEKRQDYSEKAEESAAAEASGEKEGMIEGMSSMAWFSQVSAAANTRAASPAPGAEGQQQGRAAETSTKRKKSDNVDAPNKKPKISKAEKEEPRPDKKRKQSGSAPKTTMPNKKPKVSKSNKDNPPESRPDKKRKQSDPAHTEAPNKKPEVSKAEVDDESDLSSFSESELEPAPKQGQKRKQPTASVPSPLPKEPRTTKSGRVVKLVIEQASDGEAASDDAKGKEGRKHSRVDYVPSPTTPADDGESDGGNKRRKPKPNKGKGKPVTAPSAPVPPPPTNAAATARPARPAGGIQVPQRADGTPDYDRVTVVNLRALAKQIGLKLTGAKRKADIIKKFEDDDASGPGENAGGVTV